MSCTVISPLLYQRLYTISLSLNHRVSEMVPNYFSMLVILISYTSYLVSWVVRWRHIHLSFNETTGWINSIRVALGQVKKPRTLPTYNCALITIQRHVKFTALSAGIPEVTPIDRKASLNATDVIVAKCERNVDDTNSPSRE